MNRKILLVSDNSALVTRLTKLSDNWQLTTTPILPPDFLLSRYDQMMIILDTKNKMMLSGQLANIELLREQFHGALLAIGWQEAHTFMTWRLMSQCHFDDVLDITMRDEELRARMMQKIWVQEHHEIVETAGQTKVQLQLDQLVIDFQHYRVSIGGRPIEMGPLEFRLLVFFVQNANIVLTRGQIAEGVWHNRRDTTMRAIDSHISKLRKLIEVDAKTPRQLVTVRGFGFQFKSGKITHLEV